MKWIMENTNVTAPARGRYAMYLPVRFPLRPYVHRNPGFRRTAGPQRSRGGIGRRAVVLHSAGAGFFVLAMGLAEHYGVSVFLPWVITGVLTSRLLAANRLGAFR